MTSNHARVVITDRAGLCRGGGGGGRRVRVGWSFGFKL